MGFSPATTRYQKLLERIPHLAWFMTEASDMWAGRGEIITVNQHWHEYMGRIPADSHPYIFEEILCAAECERFLDCWQAAIRLQESLDIKLQLKNVSGDWEWFQIELEPDRDAWGQTIWIGTAVKLGGAAALHRKNLSVQFIEALLSHAADGIVACDTDGHLVLFNRAAQLFHGLPPEPIEPEDWANYYDLYDGDGTRLLTKSEIPLFRAWQGAAVVDQEMMIKSPQGGERSLLASGDAIYSPTGEKLGAVVLMRDITAFKQAEI